MSPGTRRAVSSDTTTITITTNANGTVQAAGCPTSTAG